MPDSNRRTGLVSVAVYPETKETWLDAAAEDPNADSLSQFVRVAVQRHLRDRAVGGRAELFDERTRRGSRSDGRSGIPLGFEVRTDNDESVGTLVHLTAEQAEALAVDLLEQAHAAREMADE